MLVKCPEACCKPPVQIACEHGQKLKHLVALSSSEVDLCVGVHAEEQPWLSRLAIGVGWKWGKMSRIQIVMMR